MKEGCSGNHLKTRSLSSNETSKVQSIVDKHSVEPQPMKIYVSINVYTDTAKGEFGNNSAFLWEKDVKKSKKIFRSVAFRQSDGYWYYLTSIHTFIGAPLRRPGWKSLPCPRRGTVLQCPLISQFCTVKKRTHNNTDIRAPVQLERKSRTSDTLYCLLTALCTVTPRALESFIYSHLTFASIHLHLLHAKSINTGSYFSRNNFIPQWLIFTVLYLSGSSKNLSGY